MTTDSELRALLADESLPWEAHCPNCNLIFATADAETEIAEVFGHDADSSRRDLVVAAVNSLPSLLDRLKRAEWMLSLEHMQNILGNSDSGLMDRAGLWATGRRSSAEMAEWLHRELVRCSLCGKSELTCACRAALEPETKP